MNKVISALNSTLLAINFSTSSAKYYRIAVTDIQGMDALISEWGPFKSALQKATRHSFEFFPVASQTATAEALRSEKLDFAITGPAEYVAIDKLTDAKSMIGLARPDYYCEIVVKDSDGINRVSDVKGKAGGRHLIFPKEIFLHLCNFTKLALARCVIHDTDDTDPIFKGKLGHFLEQSFAANFCT